MSLEVGNFLLDLVNIEVNTIVKPGITAEKMPEPWIAVHDVLVDYLRFLDQPELASPPLPTSADELLRGEAIGRSIAAIADAAERAGEARPADKAIFDRMRTNLALLTSFRAQAGPDPKNPAKLSLKQRMAIRKMWEIGTEHVVIQTCISLDGDVVTRIAPELIAHEAEVRELLLSVHRESTSVSVRFWTGLVDAATNLIGGLRKWGSSSSSATGA